MASRLSTVIAAAPETDLAVVAAMAAQFESYILKGQVYRTVVVPTRGDHRGAGERPVQSSGGDVLARLHKLAAQSESLSPEQRQALTEAKARTDAATGRLPSHYQALLLREARARLNSLNWFLDDCSENRRECRVQYPFEIRNRQRIAEIGKALEAHSADALTTQLAAVDQRLQAMLTRGEFVWEAAVAHVYPREEYWYLYGLPAGPDP
ncbi:MAG: hypothetical protein F4X14_11270 [Caldilineaceae bacterium SB0661_bin_32]|uniref:Uncharacterized protein n=1 Tax=Caldilineaceae bacterium SB0661_bin_32 TaxID=2605255 RepID=A0A6B1D6G5_9CHLR|nr:hypothetical protein [Caldilineaceae bacterium SB0661_bin_32]